ncbi:MAG TPA: LytTR family DNA-binding domain-containing protein [Candidatus Kapabacteria bacterium]|nr:LytTR family DNA-binding domain-containing protein [Candidatus Kapabacteria bacterium]HPO63468.1 LytTR family DNA-binding domain-containing protein [Candidatus Kapabacteria bacterium]
MLNFLLKPYPFNDDLKHNAKTVLFISLGVLAFLLIFQPIEVSEFSQKEIFYLLSGLALSTFFILTLNLIVIPSLFKKISANWDIKREIIWNIWILFAISGSDFVLYTQLFGIININYSDIGRILLLGSLPVAVLIIINQQRLLRSNLKSAQQLNKKLIENKQHKEKLIHFESEYKKDGLIVSANSLVMIKAADNYIEIFFESDNQIQKQLIRSSLNKAEEKIAEFDFIIKCHRSFIVNINHIKEIKGNSQGYMLYFENIDFPALVSQNNIEEFKKLI